MNALETELNRQWERLNLTHSLVSNMSLSLSAANGLTANISNTSVPEVSRLGELSLHFQWVRGVGALWISHIFPHAFNKLLFIFKLKDFRTNLIYCSFDLCHRDK